MSKKLCLVWPAQAVITESLFRHYSMLAEVAGYLTDNSAFIKYMDFSVMIEDCAVVPHTAMNMARIVHESDLIAVAINMNNIREAIDTANFFKSVNKNRIIIAYGEAVSCNACFFGQQNCFDYIIENGQFELGIEAVINEIFEVDWNHCDEFYNSIHYTIKEKIVSINRDTFLPPEKWGIPKLELLPLKEYLRIGRGELHITACKGCPFDCEFCNEVLVSTNKIRYRNIDQIVDYLCSNVINANSVYLDSSTFSFDRKWVIDLCKKLISTNKNILPWKTCTRLDCIDDELLYWMGKANCRRISIGVESISLDIQKRNHKIIEEQKLIRFSEKCYENGIIPRALMIIGLKGQNSSEILRAKAYLDALKIQTRFRVLQDFSFMLTKEKLELSDFDQLNRWLINSPMHDLDVNDMRFFEYPKERNDQNFS